MVTKKSAQNEKQKKWRKRKTERECKGACNGPVFFNAKSILATRFQARTSFTVTKTTCAAQRPSPSTITSGEKRYGK